MYLVGEISKKGLVDEIIYESGTYRSGNPPDADILSHIVSEFGGVTTDYAVLHIDEKSDDFKRIRKEEANFILSWTGDVIVGLDFSAYDTWNVVEITADKAVMNPNETAVITLSMYDANGTDVDGNYNSQIDLDYLKGSGTILTEERIKFKNGQEEFDFTPSEPGIYKFPANIWNDNSNNLRVKNQVTVKVRMVF
jgi:hypothetical protein